jgi:LPS-assembly protein
MFPSRSRLAVGALFCLASPATWAATSLPPLKVDPRLLGLPALPGAPPAMNAPPAVTPAPAEPAPAQPPVPEAAPADGRAPTPAPVAAPAHPPAARPLPPPAAVAPRPLVEQPATPPAPSPAPAAQEAPSAEETALSPLQLTQTLPTTRPRTDEPTPAFVSAMEIQGHAERELDAQGDVELRKLGLRVNADQVHYDARTDELHAQGNVRLQSDSTVAKGPDLQLNLATQTGHMDQPQYLLATEHGRGQASKAEFLGKDKMRLEGAAYTTCAPGQDDWFIRAGQLQLDRSTQEGVARNARVEFMGVPLLYTPWISFPLSRQRKSGLLAPSFGTTGNSGTEFSLPYYWNIAPNYDATITPRLMQKRGLQLGGEFRYLQPNYAGTLQLEMLSNDNVTHTDRSALFLQHQQNIGYGFSGTLNVQRVSDNDYFRDLSTLVTQTAQSVLPAEGVLNYANGGLNILGRVQRFQVLQDPLAPITEPYDRQPQIVLGYNKLDVLGSDLRLAGEYTDFRSGSLVSGKRLVVNPSISVPLTRSYGYLTPKIGVHYTRYSLDSTTLGLPDATGTFRTYATDATRTLPIYSLDGALVFERDASLFGQSMVQTLEPRLYYLYVPYKDQSQLPSFDSGEADFNFAQIFSENRFSGSDRISDANQLTLALTSRYLEPATGQERLRAMIGQRLSFSVPRVTLVAAAPRDRRSDFLASLGGLVAPGWSLDSAWEYNPNEAHTQRFNVGARYAPEPGKVANLSYRFNRNTLRQVDASTQWPLTAQWQGVARWNYSIQDRRLLEGLAGLEYNKGCWALRLVAHRFATATQQTTNAFFIQLQLTGLSSLGSNPLSLLRQSITGYSQGEPQLGEYNPDDF